MDLIRIQGLNEVSIDMVIQQVTQEVVSQLKKAGIKVTLKPGQTGTGIINALTDDTGGVQRRTERIDMSKYKTPVLTERHIHRLHELTGKIIIPSGTLITPKARETAKRKQILFETE